MGSCGRITQRCSHGNSSVFQRQFCNERFSKCKSLYSKDLLGHFGCVNAIEFSKDGSWLVSGGDDKRVLLWDFAKVTRQIESKPILMKTEHQSNIFCTVFDNNTQYIFSAGNDDRVIRHDINRQEAVGHFHHEEPVYCISLPSDDENLFATAGEGGTVLIWDVRIPEENKLCLAMSSSSFHGVSFNPFESRLIATANANDGVTLFDLRYPERPLINYGSPGKRKSAMFAKFNQLGTQILALMRHTGPALYNIHEKRSVVEFSHTDYSNVCTMKSPCFMGDDDQYVVAGSDDFNIYIWENPGKDWQDTVVKVPFMVLEGHRSIVNQVRYNHHAQALASSGVEKCVKLWSQFKMNGCSGSITEQEEIPKRTLYSHDQYMQFIVETGEPLSHDYDTQSLEEDPRMIAFFDSLIQRVNAGWFADESSDEESPINNVLMRIMNERNDEDDENQNLTIMDLRRLFRSNRRLLLDELEEDEETRWSDYNNTVVESDTDASDPGLESFAGIFSVSQDSDEDSDQYRVNRSSSKCSSSSEEDENHTKVPCFSHSNGHIPGIVTTQFSESSSPNSHSAPGNKASIPGKSELINGCDQALPGSSKDSVYHVSDKSELKIDLHTSINFSEIDADPNNMGLLSSDSQRSSKKKDESDLDEKDSNERDLNSICDCLSNQKEGNLKLHNKIKYANYNADDEDSISSTPLNFSEPPREGHNQTTSYHAESGKRKQSTENCLNNSDNAIARCKNPVAVGCTSFSLEIDSNEQCEDFPSDSAMRDNEGVNGAESGVSLKTAATDCDANEGLDDASEEHEAFKKCKGYRERPYRKHRKK